MSDIAGEPDNAGGARQAKRVLFVCTGNLCRSPMAEGLLHALVRGRADVEVQSAGLSAVGGQPPSLPAIDVLLDEGIDIGAQRSQPVTADLVAWATHIFTMTRGHLEALAQAFPEAVERIFLVREFQAEINPLERDIEDPIGCGPEMYAQARDAIRDALPSILRFIGLRTPDAAGCAAVHGDSMTARELAQTDPEIAAAIAREHRRQYENIELIASENFTSRAVMEAQGSVLTNKYAEGYPGRRWYGGCDHVDEVERLAIDRARRLFGAAHVNVQPHSGSQANMAVYFAALEPGDKILTMDLAHGGHLTHGNRANFSGRFFQVTHYGVSRQDERLDYDALAELAARERPRMITAGASAYPRAIDFERLARIAESVGAYLFVDMAHIAGLVAAGVHSNPVPHAHFVTTTTHKSLRGPRGGLIFCREEFARQIDSQVFPGTQGGPLMHVVAAKAVCLFEALQPGFRAYQLQVVSNAKALAARLAHNSLRIVSGGTDNHLLLVDLRPVGVNGAEAQQSLDEAGITVNKNAIPFDTLPVTKPAGIRLGTPAITTRGAREDEMMEIADLITETLTHRDDPARVAAVREAVHEITRRFPLPTPPPGEQC